MTWLIWLVNATGVAAGYEMGLRRSTATIVDLVLAKSVGTVPQRVKVHGPPSQDGRDVSTTV